MWNYFKFYVIEFNDKLQKCIVKRKHDKENP